MIGRNKKQPATWSCVALEPRWMLAGEVGAVAGGGIEVPAAVSSEASRDFGASVDQSNSAGCIAFVDSSLSDLDVLTSSLAADAELVLLDPEVDFLGQIGRHLQFRQGLSSIHIITHGAAGELRLGSQVIDAESLKSNANRLRTWSASLNNGADILLYGCQTGAGESGEEFVDLMAAMTGADVAASTDRTGADALGADWDLELSVGKVNTPVVVGQRTIDRYRHALDVVVNARGEMGDEVFELLIDNSVVGTFNASTDQQSFTHQTDDTIDARQVSVRFVNDDYDVARGIDRNLIVDNIEIDGVVFESESESTYSTGTWLAADGPTPGFGRGQTLHTNGSFQYGGLQNGGPLQLNGMIWQGTKPGTNARLSTDGTALIVGPGGNEQVFTYVDLAGGEQFVLDVEAELVTDGSGSRLRGFIGVDFFDSHGNEIGEAINIVNPFWSLPNIEVSGIAPTNTAFATVWLSHINSSPSETSELVVRNVQFDKMAVSSDSTPPTATLQTDVVTVQPNNPFPSSPSFVVLFGDETQPGVSNQTAPNVTALPVTVTAPDGTVTTPPVFTGGPGPGPGQIFNVIGVPEGPGGFVEGEYVVSIKPNTVFDDAGNAVPSGVIGRFRVEIDEGPANPEDTTPPTVELLTRTVRSDRNEFTLRSADSQSRIRFHQQGDITVIGPDGSPIEAIGIAGGNGQEPNTLFELYQIQSPVLSSGLYQVYIDPGYVIDESGNVNEAGFIGEFEYIVV